jgi:hypothetical protein
VSDHITLLIVQAREALDQMRVVAAKLKATIPTIRILMVENDA